MRAVEHDYRRARRAVILLVYVKVPVLEVQWKRKAFARDGRQQRGVYVEVDRVAELVRLRSECGLDARCLVVSVVTTDRRLAETAEKFLKRFVAEKVEPLFRDLKFDVSGKRRPDLAVTVTVPHLAALLGRNFLK